MGYEIGDRVRFMDFEGDGHVVSVPQGGRMDIEVDGMRMNVSVLEVVPVYEEDPAEERHRYEGNAQVSRFKQQAIPGRSPAVKGRKARTRPDIMEVDLHIGKIREKYPAARNIPDEDALSVQLDVFEKSMAEAFRKGVKYVVFIHGNGRGVLRRELEKRLREYPGVSVCDASPLRYGSGAMEVTVR